MLKIVEPWSLPNLPQKRSRSGGDRRPLRRVSDGYVAMSGQMFREILPPMPGCAPPAPTFPAEGQVEYSDLRDHNGMCAP
jgi:hypothetical protein